LPRYEALFVKHGNG